MEGSGADFQIQRLHYDAPLLGPEVLQGKHQILKCFQVLIFFHAAGCVQKIRA